jgi:acyl-CoA dehydrogenase
MVEALEDGRLLSPVWAITIWRHMRMPMPPKVKGQYQRSWGEGQGFAPMQVRLSTRRLQMASWSIGMAQRALEMMLEYAPQRVVFGEPLANRQSVQWWITDAYTRIKAATLMTYETAWKLDRGADVRTEISAVKAYATEMAYEVIDHAMQLYGAMGVTKELPLSLMSGHLRTMRIYDGPTEVHKWVVARNLLGLKR